VSVVVASHFVDPCCPSSWALEPALRKLVWEFDGSLRLTYVMCGMAQEFGDPVPLVGEMLAASAASGHNDPEMSDAYAAAGVDTTQADAGVAGLVAILRGIDPGRSSRAVPLPGHYASVIRVAPGLGIALATDSVGSKVVVAEQAGRFDTIGIDCVAMNVNDLVCVGAQPLALLDYIAVERADPELLRQLGVGLRAGAELAGVEIPGGEVCQIPEVIRGYPSPNGFDLVGSAFGTVALDAILDGGDCAPGDAVIGLPSSGVHSNGLTLARRALIEDGGLALDAAPAALGGDSVADVLLEPTTIYVRAILELLGSEIAVHGLAHITGGGVLNLLRIGSGIGYEISAPLPVPPVFELISELGDVSVGEMWEVFNMGFGFAAIVAAEDAEAAVALLARHHPGTAVIGRLTGEHGRIELPGLDLAGDATGLKRD
jgi:phosphoribosylformylglycinamidine cyclo-ligase